MYSRKGTQPVYVRTSKLHGHKAVKGTGDVKDSAARERIRMAAPSIRTHGRPLRRRGIPKKSGARRSHSTNTLRHRRGTKARGREERELAMARPIKLHALQVPEVGLRAYRRDLIMVKMDFLLWGWNWMTDAIIQEWNNYGLQKLPGYRGHPDTWEIWGMNLLTVEESSAFRMRNVAQEGEEVVLANEVNSDLDCEQKSSPQHRRKRPRGRLDSQPRKKR
ncbi:hypothetical protein AXG93_2637s1110 [Marchantia polymorpha subsp. ruderalis]|uniref:Uncharacterized protein n=1 Tax=Marchantia polymorpha subsp. ruderalis TaxID=1480154 RepID=A0A176VEW8_MARPO|nr:hypothetical protein AXG93_2637s1110 [Marchantia polymorpha subsp. ruderalis]